MKAPAFGYARPASLAEAFPLFEEGRDVKVLAGGQSLIPALNMRLSAPDLLVDINDIAELRGIEARQAHIRIGALARHREVAGAPLIASKVPLIAAAMRHVAHPAVRNRGTTCGSLAYADPAAEMPACAVLLDATIVLASASGAREVSARDFFHGLYETDRREDEILTEVLVPVARADERFGFDEVALRHGDFPSVGLAVKASMNSGAVADIDVVVFGSEPKPILCAGLGDIVSGRAWSGRLRAALIDAVVGQMEPMDNLQGRPETKRRQARALLARVLDGMMEERSDAA
jgi:carbon-monoxide dehydrogenase medium subunit